mmetsp:Transcript_24443/g.43071  ORF Transcript_24443/g.43071 Transcript_24443/m.43071 type:complete len:96 (+) Transcript_24443:226-513(+)
MVRLACAQWLLQGWVASCQVCPAFGQRKDGLLSNLVNFQMPGPLNWISAFMRPRVPAPRTVELWAKTKTIPALGCLAALRTRRHDQKVNPCCCGF